MGVQEAPDGMLEDVFASPAKVNHEEPVAPQLSPEASTAGAYAPTAKKGFNAQQPVNTSASNDPTFRNQRSSY